MEEKRTNDEILACLAHDMRSPLAVINGYANALLDGTAKPENAKRYLEVIAEQSKRLSQTVEEVLTAARLDGGAVARKESFDLGLLAHDVCGDFLPGAEEKGVHIETSFDEAYVFADPLLVKTALSNLFENAVKYTEGGTVNAAVAAEEGGARFCVNNPGTLEEGEETRLTQKFYRSRSALESGVKGTGLGLYIVERALSANGSKLEISAAGGRVRFEFFLKNS